MSDKLTACIRLYFESRDDGRLDLAIQTRGAELGRLALEWGDRVEVIEPPDLRQRVRRELTAALALYEAPGDSPGPEAHHPPRTEAR